MSKRNHFRDAVWSLLKSRAGEWIDGREIATVGGAYAWRTRISDCRKFYGVTIENRIIRIPGTQGYRLSEYRYLPTGLLDIADSGLSIRFIQQAFQDTVAYPPKLD